MANSFTTSIRSVLTGRIAPLGARAAPSGIDKTPVKHPVHIHLEGLTGDEQGDRKVHGGPEKAIHHYPFEHYAAWKAEMPGIAWRLASEGAFGENISTTGMSEADVCIGDTYRLGTALVQVSQGRQPCWKLNERFGERGMAKRVQETGRTGWYYRILEQGMVEAGNIMTLVERPADAWSLHRIQNLLYRDTMNLDELATLSTLPHLAESWRKLARRRLERHAVEDWSKRLEKQDG